MNARRLLVLVCLLAALVPASSATASFPGPVGRIVFTSPGSSTSDIYSAAADGTDLIDEPAHVRQARLAAVMPPASAACNRAVTNAVGPS